MVYLEKAPPHWPVVIDVVQSDDWKMFYPGPIDAEHQDALKVAF